ncbi:MAG: MBL fold metallo-hydrolase, partial [Chitinophagaceae bacterium]
MLTLKKFVFGPVEENTYLVYDARGECAIIDPGCTTREEQEVLAGFIAAESITPKLLLNTHCHFDHVAGNAWVNRTYGLLPQLHVLEKPLLKFAAEAAKLWGLYIEPYTGNNLTIAGGEVLTLGQHRIELLFTPGHSPGSLSFYFPTEQWVLSGDVLFELSVGRTDLPGGDYDTLIRSIREKLFILPDKTKVFSGHGPATTIGEE